MEVHKGIVAHCCQWDDGTIIIEPASRKQHGKLFDMALDRLANQLSPLEVRPYVSLLLSADIP